MAGWVAACDESCRPAKPDSSTSARSRDACPRRDAGFAASIHLLEPPGELRGIEIKGRGRAAGAPTTVQFKVLWQLPQSRTVLTCCTCLPVAVMPLWQLTQDALSPRWLKATGPCERAVAGAAVQIRLHVLRRLARRQRAVVAAHARCGDPLVIEARRQPGEDRVAVLAGIVARDVRRPLARRQRAVVAACAVAGHARRATGAANGAAPQRRKCAARVRARRRRGSGNDGADHRGTASRAAAAATCPSRVAAVPVVRVVAAAAVLAHMMAARARGQIGHAVEFQGGEVVACVAGPADHREHRGVLGRSSSWCR